MKATTFLLPAVAAILLTAASANAASPGFGTGSSTLGAPLPNDSNPGAIGGAPQSLQPTPSESGGLGYATPTQTYSATPGGTGNPAFSPGITAPSTSGPSQGG